MRQFILLTTLVCAMTLPAAVPADALLQKARSGDVTGCLQLAGEFMFGRNGRNANPALAVYWYRQAAVRNSGAGQFNLALCYRNGWGTAKRPAAAYVYFQKALANGVVPAAAYCAEMLYEGVDAANDPEGDFAAVKADPEAAITLLRRYASKDPAAESMLAKYLFRHVDQYAAELLTLLKKHAEKRDFDPDMLIIYAACLRSGAGGVVDPQLAAVQLERAAGSGNAEAMAQFAELLFDGFGVKRDPVRAKQMLDGAISRGSARAMVTRGNRYMYGADGEISPAQAWEMFTLAAEKKYPPAMRQKGFCLAGGIGTERDEKAALHWYLLAARANDAPAQYLAAQAYHHGRGTEKDFQAAYFWYLRAAENGELRAMSEVENALREGRGVPRDPERAAMWAERIREAQQMLTGYPHLQ